MQATRRQHFTVEMGEVDLVLTANGGIFNTAPETRTHVLGELEEIAKRELRDHLRPALELLIREFTFPEGITTSVSHIIVEIDDMQFQIELELSMGYKIETAALSAIVSKSLSVPLFSQFVQLISELQLEGSLPKSHMIDLVNLVGATS